jgi:hypothetical protein
MKRYAGGRKHFFLKKEAKTFVHWYPRCNGEAA